MGLTAVRRGRRRGGGGSGSVGACGGCGTVGCEAVTRRGGLRGGGLAHGSSGSSGGAGGHSSRILTDLLHEIPHEVGWKGAYSRGGKRRTHRHASDYQPHHLHLNPHQHHYVILKLRKP